MRNSIILTLVVLFASGAALAQRNLRITSNSVAGVRIGMTVMEAKKTLKGCVFARSSDGEGAALISVKCNNRDLLTVWAGEEDADAPVNNKAVISTISVFDKRFVTKEGVRVGMPIPEVERRLGRLKKIVMTPIESREYITFARQPRNVHFRVYGGIYSRPSTTTTRYEGGTRLFAIEIWRD